MLGTVIMTAIAVMVLVVITTGVGIIFEVSSRKCLSRLIGRTLNARVELDSRVGERHLRTYADTTADQGVDLCGLKESRQQPVPAAVGVYDLLLDDFFILDIVQLELLRMAEMLENLSVFIGDCDSHNMISFIL